MSNIKIYVVGHARHGKDTVGDMLIKKLNLKAESSSYVAAKEFLFDRLKDQFGYKTVEECFNDRHSSQEMRALWHDLIYAYNTPDHTKLSRLIFRDNDIYIGIRKKEELQASIEANLAKFYIWVDASNRIPDEDISSMSITKDMCNYVIDNNSTLEQLEINVDEFINAHICPAINETTPFVYKYCGSFK